MSLNRWLSVFLMLGLILAFSPLGAQAEPGYGYNHRYRHHHGKAYRGHGPRHHAMKRRHAYRHWREKHYPRRYVRYVGPPPVTYVQPVVPLVRVQPYPVPQPVYPQPAPPIYSEPAPPGFSAQFNFSF